MLSTSSPKNSSRRGSGESGGKKYDEVRHYATLTVVPASTAGAKAAGSPPKAEARPPFAMLPEAVNSFGGAVLGDWQQRALDALAKACDLQTPAEAANYWEKVIATDSALIPIRHGPGFNRLADRYAPRRAAMVP